MMLLVRILVLIAALFLSLVALCILIVSHRFRQEARDMLRQVDDIRDDTKDIRIQAEARVKEANAVLKKIRRER